jgi:WD40 repeat protein
LLIASHLSARSENAVLKEKLKTLAQKCHVLTVENEVLKAEVEIYRQEGGGPNVSSVVAQVSSSTDAMSKQEDATEDFIKSGNGVYASSCGVNLEKMHDIANLLSCSLSPDDTVLCSGAADGTMMLCQWGAALNGQDVMSKAVKITCSAPVICNAFAAKLRFPFVVGGCMDGSVHLVKYSTPISGIEAKAIVPCTIKHGKYVKCVAWSPTENLFASASADGTVQVHKVVWNGYDDNVSIETVQSLHVAGPVEALCFHQHHLCAYARGTPYLSYFDLEQDYLHTKINLNQGPGNGVFSDHVSFCVMDMVPKNKFLALATDINRNIVLDFETGKQVRNLYGHKNDGYSNPKLAWSASGQYLYGNTQEDSHVCVWDIASSQFVNKLGGHTNPVRAMFSSSLTDTLVTTSFDKMTKIWLAPAESS